MVKKPLVTFSKCQAADRRKLTKRGSRGLFLCLFKFFKAVQRNDPNRCDAQRDFGNRRYRPQKKGDCGKFGQLRRSSNVKELVLDIPKPTAWETEAQTV